MKVRGGFWNLNFGIACPLKVEGSFFFFVGVRKKQNLTCDYLTG